MERPLALLAASSLWETLDGGSLLIACSGGPDSVALTVAVHELLADAVFSSRFDTSPTVELWHLDHGLRPDSARDAEFVRDLGHNLGFAVTVETAELGARLESEGGNAEALARDERYSRLLNHLKGRGVALTGHHLDDQAETILHHIIRGTHLTGLRGISSVYRGVIHRPWLHLRRSEILKFLELRSQNYVTDPTNAELSLTRNRLRHEVLPLLHQLNPRASEHIAALAGAAAEAQALRAGKLAELEVQGFDAGELSGWLPLLGWPGSALEVHRLWQGWVASGQLEAYVAAQLQRRLGMLSAEEHGMVSDWATDPANRLHMRELRAELPHPELLCLHDPRGADLPVEPARLEPGRTLLVSGLEVEVGPADERSWWVAQRRERHTWKRIRSWPEALAAMCASPPEQPTWQCFLGEVEFPLTLRTWQPGERIELAGGGSKTLGDVFTDAKVPEGLRPLWAVLVDGANQPVWLPGLVDGAAMRIEGQPRWMLTLRQSYYSING